MARRRLRAEDAGRKEELLQSATPEQRQAVEFLERKGLTFLIHFGYGNAIKEMQAYHWHDEHHILAHYFERHGVKPEERKGKRRDSVNDRRNGPEAAEAGPARVFRKTEG